MGIIVKPNTFVDATGPVDGGQWNGNFFTLFNGFNGNIDDANIKALAKISGKKLKPYSIFGSKLGGTCIQEPAINYTYPGGVGVCRTVAVKRRSVVGYKEFTYGGGGLVSVTVTFSTDCTISVPPGVDFGQGDPGFNSTPRVTIGLMGVLNLQNFYNITAISNTAFTVEIKATGGAGLSGTMFWRAIGSIP